MTQFDHAELLGKYLENNRVTVFIDDHFGVLHGLLF